MFFTPGIFSWISRYLTSQLWLPLLWSLCWHHQPCLFLQQINSEFKISVLLILFLCLPLLMVSSVCTVSPQLGSYLLLNGTWRLFQDSAKLCAIETRRIYQTQVYTAHFMYIFILHSTSKLERNKLCFIHIKFMSSALNFKGQISTLIWLATTPHKNKWSK